MIEQSTAQVTVSSPAKVNLALGVGQVRDDGFHPLATVYQAVGIFDDIRVRPADEDSLTVYGEGVDVADVPTDGSNLALRAARLLAEHHGLDAAVEVRIHKRIPVAGGLAGGSTDAAGALLACDTLWGLRTPREELMELAAELGSDVPFCLVGGTALGSGRGEVVTPAMTRGRYWWLVLPADGGLSTPAVYAEFDRLTPTVAEPEIPEEMLAALRAGDAVRLGASLTNDLQRAALQLRPGLEVALTAGLEGGAHGALVTGSGPTTVFLCQDREHAQDLQVLLTPDFGPGLVAEAPVHGARVREARA